MTSEAQHIERIKYPRTPHLWWSPGSDADDIGISESAPLVTSSDVVATIKYDGENTTVYPDGTCHARSANSGPHPSRTWMRGEAARIGPLLPAQWRLCGENLYARHSIGYDDLESWFYAFSFWDHHGDEPVAVDWDTTVEWAQLIDVPAVAVIYRGPFDRTALTDAFAPYASDHEGYVVRDAAPIAASDFPTRIAKWVRTNHVRTDRHWMFSNVTPNGLRGPR